MKVRFGRRMVVAVLAVETGDSARSDSDGVSRPQSQCSMQRVRLPSLTQLNAARFSNQDGRALRAGWLTADEAEQNGGGWLCVCMSACVGVWGARGGGKGGERRRQLTESFSVIRSQGAPVSVDRPSVI